MKLSALVPLLYLAATLQSCFAATNSPLKPILLELFTSEGCSSCPPVDAWVQKLDAAQPIPGAQVIVLSEHVDYWNHDGWKDPYSSSQITERQSTYSHALGLRDIYTPQLIVNGTAELHLNNPGLTRQVFTTAAAAQTIPIRIVSPTAPKGDAQTLTAHVEAGPNNLGHKADIFFVIALDHAESQVLRGENTGKHLSHVAVAESLKKIGKLAPGQSFNHDVQLKLPSGIEPSNIRLIAFLQEPGPGKVLGVTMQHLQLPVTIARTNTSGAEPR